ncbi:MAG: hypothetical protein WCI05_13450, partial [Myxococcales bacterium]
HWGAEGVDRTCGFQDGVGLGEEKTSSHRSHALGGAAPSTPGASASVRRASLCARSTLWHEVAQRSKHLLQQRIALFEVTVALELLGGLSPKDHSLLPILFPCRQPQTLFCGEGGATKQRKLSFPFRLARSKEVLSKQIGSLCLAAKPSPS